MSAATNGGLIGYGSSDTYSPSAGTGTYQIRWSKTDGKLYWANGIGSLSSTGLSFVPVHNGDPVANGLTWSNAGQTQIEVYGDVVKDTSAVLRLDAAYNGAFSSNPYISISDVSNVGSIELESPDTYLKLGNRGAFLKYGLRLDGTGASGYQSSQVYGLQVLNGGIANNTTTTPNDGQYLGTVTGAVTNTTANLATFQHSSTDTPAAGFGGDILINLHSSTNTPRAAGLIRATWVTATDASRASRMRFFVFDTVGRDALTLETSGTAPKVGFMGAAAVGRQNITGTRTGTLAQLQTVVANLLTGLANLGLITDSTT